MIITERLALRQLTESDWPFIIELVNQPDFIKNVGDKAVGDKASALTYLAQGPMLCHKTHGFSLLAMTLTDEGSEEKDIGKVIGMCGLLKRDNLNAPDIGYALLPDYYRRGYTLEAASAVLKHHQELKLVYGLTNTENLASIRLLEKLGFKQRKAPLTDREDTVFLELSR